MTPALTPHLIAQFAAGLREAGFVEARILAALNAADLLSMSTRQKAVWTHRTREDSTLNHLIRLFILGLSLPLASARQSGLPMELMRALELIEVHDEEVRSRIHLVPFKEYWFASDRPYHVPEGLAPGFVMGVGGSTVTLLNLAIQRPGMQVLDLGCGCGTHAVCEAKTAAAVTAADINPRATAFAQFNGLLNGLTNLQVLTGDLLAPVAGRQFDLIITNPPFVISPGNHFVFRDGGRSGDHFVQGLIRQVPAHLHEGGYCEMLANWALRAGETWQEHVRPWVEGTGCDAWVFCSEVRDVATYASVWIQQAEGASQADCQGHLAAWMDYYQKEQIERVGAGAIILRKRSGGANWVHMEEAPEMMYGPCGDDLAAGFGRRDFVAANPGEALLRHAYKTSGNIRLHQTLAPCEEGWQLEKTELIRTAGLSYRGTVDGLIAGLLTRCDGRKTMLEVIGEMSRELESSQEAMAAGALAAVRSLVERGFLEPVLPGKPTEGQGA